MNTSIKDIRIAIDAFEQDGEIQVQGSPERWQTITDPIWNFDKITYRPVPKLIEYWVVIDENNRAACVSHGRAYANLRAKELGYTRVVHMVEADE